MIILHIFCVYMWLLKASTQPHYLALFQGNMGTPGRIRTTADSVMPPTFTLFFDLRANIRF